MRYEQLINELAELCGIMPGYWDIFGKHHITSVETKRFVLRAMKVKITSESEIKQEIEERKSRTWKNILVPVHVLSEKEQPIKIPLYIPVRNGEEDRLLLAWNIRDEQGQKNEFVISGGDVAVLEERSIDGTRYIRTNLTDATQRAIGYYTVKAECRHPDNIFPGEKNILQQSARVIVTPDTCYLPPALETKKAWGLSINLYSMRSDLNWGIGDFAGLKTIVRHVSGLHGGFVGINPLHAISNRKPYGISPYSPVSRLYKNYIYLDVENIPDVMESGEARSLITSASFRNEINELRDAELIDYEKAASLKEKALRIAFQTFYETHFKSDTQRCRDFKNYVAREGGSLESFALFLALWEYMKKARDVYAWQQWPEAYRNPAGRAVQAFKEEHKEEVLFYQYLQWLIDEQLAESAELCRNHGMPIGIYHDLAIGAVAGGSDTWNYQDIIGIADVGAPPDDFSPDGQNWGFPPMIPEKLKESGYELFIQTIKKNMRYGGALRIDHALGLFRLFWIPEGASPAGGAYVECPSEDLLRIIALESVRNRTVVIAEDLGTVGDNVRADLKRFNMLSYKLFYFERNYPDPSFVPPDKYPEMALCAVTTHDLPTLYGFWTGHDLEVKKELGKYSDDTLWRQQRKDRERDKGLVLAALKSQGILPEDFSSDPDRVPFMTPELCTAIYNYLARTPCKLLLVSLDDIIGTLNQQNLPGTVDSHPNWVQKMPLSLEELLKDERLNDLAGMLRTNMGC